MTRLTLKQPGQSKSSKPKKKKGINQVIRQVAATAANHFDDEDPCELPHCEIGEKPCVGRMMTMMVLSGSNAMR